MVIKILKGVKKMLTSKRWRKILTIMFAALLVLGTTLTSFAEEDYTYTYYPDWDPKGGAEAECELAGCDGEFAIKTPSNTTGVYGPITYTALTERSFEWESVYPVHCVIVKAGEAGHVYCYSCTDSGPSYGDTIVLPEGSQGVSHVAFCYDEVEYGSLKVTADVAKEHDVVDYYKEWAQDFAKEWAQDFAKEWAQDFAKEWAQDFAKEWAQDFAKEWAQDFTEVYTPVFEKYVTYSGTLVSGITLGYGTDGASGLPGGYLNNGMTYLTIYDIGQYTEEDPLEVWIADSSPQNKKSDPTEYNKNTEFMYDLYVDDGKVFITLDDDYRIIEMDFGILVSDKAFTGNPTRSVTHDNNPDGTAVTADSDCNTYVFFHIGGASRYTTGMYEFVDWEFWKTALDCDPYFFEKVLDGIPYSVTNFPGEYTVTLMKGVTEIGRKDVTVNPSEKATAAFTDTIDVDQGPDVTIDGNQGPDV